MEKRDRKKFSLPSATYEYFENCVEPTTNAYSMSNYSKNFKIKLNSDIYKIRELMRDGKVSEGHDKNTLSLSFLRSVCLLVIIIINIIFRSLPLCKC